MEKFHKTKIVEEKVVTNLQIQFREFIFYGVISFLFMLNESNFIFMLFEAKRLENQNFE